MKVSVKEKCEEAKSGRKGKSWSFGEQCQ